MPVTCLSALLALGFNCCIFAQDTIITRDGRFIIGQVTEVSSTAVTYKKVGIEEGPFYREDKSEVERIKYKNGFTDIFPEIKPWQLPIGETKKQGEPLGNKPKPVLEKRGGKYLHDHERLSENQLYRLLLTANDPQINYQVKMAKRDRGLQYIGFAAAPLAGLSVLSLMAANDVRPPGKSNKPEEDASKVFMGCAGFCLGSSIYFKIKRKHRNAEAVRLYKQKFE